MPGYAHRAVLVIPDGDEPAAPGGAITVELCGHWEHEPPCRYPHLTEQGVEGNFEHATPQEIHTRVWPIVSAWFQARKDQVLSEYTQLVGREQVMDDLQMVAQAAVQPHP